MILFTGYMMLGRETEYAVSAGSAHKVPASAKTSPGNNGRPDSAARRQIRKLHMAAPAIRQALLQAAHRAHRRRRQLDHEAMADRLSCILAQAMTMAQLLRPCAGGHSAKQRRLPDFRRLQPEMFWPD